MQDQIDRLREEINKISINVNNLTAHNYAIFTPSSKGYAIINSNLGFFAVSLDSLHKYADGYKATLSIGNVNSITFSGIKLLIRWGKAYNSENNFNNWLSSLKSEEIEINKNLLPGVWNKVAVVLSPATAKETGFISVALITNQIYLHADIRNYLE